MGLTNAKEFALLWLEENCQEHWQKGRLKMPVFRVRTLDTSGDPGEHVVEITEEGFTIDGFSGNCLRLREGWELVLGKYAGYPSNLRRDRIPVISTFGVLEGMEQDSLAMEVPIQTRIPQPPALAPRRSRERMEGKEYVIVITPEGFRVGKECLGDCLLLEAGQELVLMSSRETLETKMRGEESLGQYIAITEFKEAFGIVVSSETRKEPELPKQIPLHLA